MCLFTYQLKVRTCLGRTVTACDFKQKAVKNELYLCAFIIILKSTKHLRCILMQKELHSFVRKGHTSEIASTIGLRITWKSSVEYDIYKRLLVAKAPKI